MMMMLHVHHCKLFLFLFYFQEKQQSSQITYADLAEFNHNAPQAAVKPVPYQPSEYAVIIGQKKQS
jgi:hypothetical protein